MKGRGSLFWALGVFAILVLAFGALFVRRQMRIHEYRQYRAWSEAVARTHTDNAPPPDYHGWLAEFGANEPDSATPEGRATLEAEKVRLPAARERLRKVVGQFHSMLVSEDEAAEGKYLSSFVQVFDGFSRASCAELLKSVPWGECRGDRLRNTVTELGPGRGATVIERYYRVVCSMVDLLWTRGGLECEAAEIDDRIYVSLKHSGVLAHRRGWGEMEAAIDRCLKDWKKSRCDSENSNFCRAHRFWEERYNLYYRERVRHGETNWLKILSAYYRSHLERARRILKREPKWSPGAGHGLYDDAPGGVKPLRW